MTEFRSVEEISPPLTEEQWQQYLAYFRQTYGPLLAARRFRHSIRELERTARQSQQQIGEISRAMLDMAEGKDE